MTRVNGLLDSMTYAEPLDMIFMSQEYHDFHIPGFDTDVRRTIGNINGRLSNVVFNGGTTAGSQAASTATVFNVTFNAPVDREGVAREIRKILRDYDRKRGN